MKRQVDICYTFFLFPQFSHTTTKYRISICPAMVLCQVQQSPVLMPSISSSICLQGSAITVGPQARSSSLQSPFWPPIFPLSFNSLWCTPAVKISTTSKQVRLSRVANYKVRKKKKKRLNPTESPATMRGRSSWINFNTEILPVHLALFSQFVQKSR